MNDGARKGKAGRVKARAAKPGPAKVRAAKPKRKPARKPEPEPHGVADQVRRRVKHIATDAPAAARGAYATGRDLARRGAETVTRVAGDNTALTTLVAGAAVAAVGWLVLGRRRKEGGEG